jgi:transcription termination/antitermination protein NusG
MEGAAILNLSSNYENWYALFVMTGEEENVKLRLKYRFGDGMKVLVPRRRLRERKEGSWKDTVRTLFPGYVFVNGQIDIEKYMHFKQVPGLIKLLADGYEPQMIHPGEMKVLGRLTGEGDIIGFSSVLVENQRVVVMNGPLTSLEGQIVSVNNRKGRAKVLLGFLGEQRTVELGVEILQVSQ